MKFATFSGFTEIKPITSSTEPIPSDWLNPHYGNLNFTRFNDGRTIYLPEGLVTISYGDSERLEHAAYESTLDIAERFLRVQEKRAQNQAKDRIGNNNTAAFFEAMLQELNDDPDIQLKHILAGFRGSSIFWPYLLFGTTHSEPAH